MPRRHVAGNVLVVRGRTFQMFAEGEVGIEDQNLLAIVVPKCLNRPDLIRIARNEGKAVRVRLRRIKKHGDGNVHVRTLLLKFHDANHSVLGRRTRSAGLFANGQHGLVLGIEPQDGLDIREGRQGLEIHVLPFDGGFVVRIGLDGRREVIDADDLIPESCEGSSLSAEALLRLG